MQAVTSFLTNAAAVQPLVVVLEDLHDADKGTLDMLTHVSRHLSGARLVIVGTYRDVEVDRNHPLSAALADLRRVSTYGRVLLRGLNADEVRRMLESITRESVPWGLAEAVHRQTEGNPLFVQEVIRFLAEEGLIVQKDGRWRPSKDTSLEMNIPEGLRDVIGKRLSLVSKKCNELLSVASVIGREFALETLRAVAGPRVSEDVLVNALKEAVRLSVLEERSQAGFVRYRFTHAFFRQTLYEEMIAPQRLKLHQQVARALETLYGKRLEEHAAELAEHFSQSTDPADLTKAISYGEMAARRATDVYAYGEAVRLLDQALKVQDILDPENKARRCELLFDLCKALYRVPDHRRIVESVAPETFLLAESMGDNFRAVQVCTYALWATFSSQGGMNTVSAPIIRQWVERGDRYALPDTVERVYADVNLATLMFTQQELRSNERLYARALNLARRLKDTDALVYCYLRGFALLQAPRHAEKRLQHAEELMTILHSTSRHTNWFGNNLGAVGIAFVASGRRQRAEEIWDEVRDIGNRTGDRLNQSFVLMTDSVRAVLDGRLEEALELSERIRSLGEEDGTLGAVIIWVRSGGMRAHIYRGVSPEELDRWHPGFWNPEETWAGARQCLMLAHWGQYEKASAILDREVASRPGVGTDDDATMTWMDTFYLEASVLAGHRQAAELLRKRLDVPGLCTNGTDVPTCIARHLGGAAALLGRHDEARQHYGEAIRVCNEMRFRPELALSRLQLAELILDHYPAEKREALEHLDFAIKEFREMKMQPSLERALRHKDILKA
jgi:tetratricopeptide (TPR) repeat protein